jgi:putative DNA primase/helicase
MDRVMAALSAADDVRLRTWSVEIAEALLPTDAQRHIRGGDWRFSHTGGLSIAKRSGAWFSHAAGVGGYSTVRLIELLRTCDRAEAEQWAAAWLASHAGTGICDGAEDDDGSQAAAQANAIRAREVIDVVVAADGTLVETYLRSRGIEPPYPDCVRFLPDARIGESALVGLLTGHDVVVGVQLTYLAPDGSKSLREPARETFLLDCERARGAVFTVEKLSGNGRLLLCEGLEDGLSLRASDRPEAIFALPGIGGLQHFPARRGQPITMVPDGDEPGSPADKALIDGLDHLLLQHADVRRAPTPLGKDANDILREEGAPALATLVEAAEVAELSRDGEVHRLARLTDPGDYDKERKAIADKFGWRVGTLDTKVKKAKPRPDKDKEASAGNGLVEREPEPWPQPVQLAEVLTTLRERLGKHIVFASEAQATVAALWIAHTWAFNRFQFTPRLAIESATPRCGKTSTHDLLNLTCYRPVEADKLTPASLVRMKSAVGPFTALLDEMGDLLRVSPELDSVLRSGFQRDKRYINLKPLPEGGFEHESHDVHGPVAISLVGALRGALADRAIHIHLRRKSAKVKVAKLRHGNNRQILLDCGRRLARWAADEADELDDEPQVPEALNDRQADFAVPLLSIADQAGGMWPAEVRAARVKLLAEGADRAEDNAILLLHDLRAIFDADLQRRRTLPAEQQEIESKLLVETLVQQQDRPWAQLESGRPMTQWKLAAVLRNFGIVPHNVGPEGTRKRGYHRLQFVSTWEAYPEAAQSIFRGDPPNQTAQTAQNVGTPPDSDGFQTAQEGSAVQSETARKTADFSQTVQSVQSESGYPRENYTEPSETPSFGLAVDNQSGTDFSLQKAEGNDPQAAQQAHGAPPLPPAGATAPEPGNGADAEAAQLGSIAAMVRLLATLHPDWSHERLAKQSGQPVATVKRMLARKPRGSRQPGVVH